jgi:hypothetical protein
MKSDSVKPSICPNSTILYDSGNFAVAIGKYENIENALLMRWNGDTESDIGYPNAHGNPMWFRIEKKLVLGILTSLLVIEKSNKEEVLDKQKILDAIQTIIKGK